MASSLLLSHALHLSDFKHRRSFPLSRAELDSGKPRESSGEKKPTGTGFGTATESKKKKKGSTERARGSVIRRTPVSKPSSLNQTGERKIGSSETVENRTVNESAFLLTWVGLGLLILVEGVALAASGFLPEQWDNFFVKYLYPSFTPTVFLFVAGTAAYGVFKYIQGEKMNS